ncbi:hypothetical protein Tco_0836901 [Tanacetum coccineum]
MGEAKPQVRWTIQGDGKVGSVAYKLELPQDLSKVHHTFHVCNLKKCYTDKPLAVLLDGLHIENKLHFIEEPIEIMDRKVKRLKQSRIQIVKVGWNSGRGTKFTLERKDQFRKKYPHLFIKTAPSSNIVMSDSEDSTVPYTTAPLSPDYVSGPEYPPLPEFVLEPVYSEFMPPEDDVLPAEEQPLPATVSPAVDSPDYVLESNPKEDPKEDEDEDPEEDPADYPTYRDEDNDEAKEPSRDEADDEEEDEDDEEEEEHPALADSVPPHVHCVMARISHFLQIQSCYDSAESQGTIYFPFTAITTTHHTLPHQIKCTSIRDTTYLNLLSLTDFITILTVPSTDHACGRLGGRDRCSHAYTALLMKKEARLSYEAWVRSMDASDTARSEVRALRTTILAHQTEIAALRAADCLQQA